MKSFFSTSITRWLFLAGGILASAFLINTLSDQFATSVSAQTDRVLESRLNVMEQRFYGIESRLNRVEQLASRPSVAAPTSTDRSAEIQFLRSQIDSLRTRIGELECAVLKLDERTLTAAARARRQSAGASLADKCRLDSSTPVQLSARP